MTWIILWVSLSALAWAQRLPSDSVKVYQSAEVVVTATRSEISEKDAPSPTEFFGPDEIRKTNGGTVADLLQIYSGAWLKEYGADAALKTISLRGSASEHVLVLIDGNRFTSFQNGVVDLSLLPLDNVERVEILHGGSSALYGADALGGVVNIITRQADSAPHVNVEASGGSFNYQRYSTRVQGGYGGLNVVSGYSNEAGKDNYPFIFHRPGSVDTNLLRNDADYRKEELFLNGNLGVDEYSVLTFSIQNIKADVGAPGPILSVSDVSLARQNDKDVNVRLSYRDHHIAGTELSLNTGFQHGFETYSDPTYLIDSFYKNIFFTANPQAQVNLSVQDRLIVGGEFAQGILQGNDFDSRIQRNQASLYVSNEYAADFNQALFDRLSLYQTVRYDDFTDVGRAWTPKFGVNLRILKPGDVRIRASYGLSYRAPSFNDLYYRNFSNPLLKPEHSHSFDVGVLTNSPFGGEHSIEVTYFLITTTDRILLDPVNYTPVNIGRTASQGIESSYRGRFFDGLLEAGLSYTFTDARKKNSSSPGDSTYNKQLMYVPQNLFKGSLSLHLRAFTINIFRIFTGMRFINEDNSQSLPSYSLTGANMSATIPLGTWKALVKAEVSNLFNVDYQGFPNYPMPGKNFRLEAGIEY